MSITAQSLGGWAFVSFEPGLEFRENPADPDVEQKRVYFSYIRKQRGKGSVSFISEVGHTAIPSQLQSRLGGSDSPKVPSLPEGGTVTKFICVRDSVILIGEGTGIVEETQEWVTYLPWEDFDLETELGTGA